MEQAERFRIPVAKLRRVCDLDTELDFCTSSADVPGLEGVIGQDRAVRSMQFGLAMDAPGYNIFVSGQPGTGKTTYVNASVTQAAADGPVPDDWCYVIISPISQARLPSRCQPAWAGSSRRTWMSWYASCVLPCRKHSRAAITNRRKRLWNDLPESHARATQRLAKTGQRGPFPVPPGWRQVDDHALEG